MKALSLAVFVFISLAEQVSQASAVVLPKDIPPLERRVTVSVQNTPFKDALAQVCRAANVELELDAEAVKEAGVSPDAPITISFKDERLDAAMPAMLTLLERGEFFDIFWKLEDNKIIISTIRAQEARRLRELPDWMKPFTNQVRGELDKDREVISISMGKISDDAFLPNLKSLPRLRELRTDRIKAEDLAIVAGFPALIKLELYGMKEGGPGLGREALSEIAKSKALRELNLSECGITDEGVAVLGGMSQLTSLSLVGNQLSDAALKHLAGLTNLQILDLSSSGSTHDGRMKISDEGLKELSGLTQLKELYLRHLNVSGKTIAFPHLQVLELSGTLVTDSSFENIARHCREMRRLQLVYTAVSDKGFKQVTNFKDLRQLSLDSEQITDEGIGNLVVLPKLEHVNLRATRISDTSLAHLAKIKTLTRLDLHGSGLPGANFGHVFTIKGLQQLKVLPDLRMLWISNFESATGYDGLRELTQLRVLELFFTNISDPEEAALQLAMPRTKVSVSGGGRKRIERAKLPPQT